MCQSTQYALHFAHETYLKWSKKSVPEISTYGAASHLKLVHGVMPNQPATMEHPISVTMGKIQE